MPTLGRWRALPGGCRDVGMCAGGPARILESVQGWWCRTYSLGPAHPRVASASRNTGIEGSRLRHNRRSNKDGSAATWTVMYVAVVRGRGVEDSGDLGWFGALCVHEQPFVALGRVPGHVSNLPHQGLPVREMGRGPTMWLDP